MIPMRASPVRALLACLLLLPACTPASTAAAGGGLVPLPSDDPLPPGQEARDPRASYWSFGGVPDGDRVEHVFQLRNEDPGDVAITRVIPSCGCTVASLRAVLPDGTRREGLPISSKAPQLLVVPPGGLAEVVVTIDTRSMQSKNQEKLLMISLTTDSPSAHFLNLEVNIRVELPFVVVPPSLQLARVPRSGGASGSVEIVQAPGVFDELDALGELPPGVHAELRREERFGSPVWIVEAGFDPPLQPGPLRAELSLSTRTPAGEPGRAVTFPMTAQVVEDLISEPERIVFAANREDPGTATAELRSLLAGQRLRVLDVRVPPEQAAWLTARAEPVDADASGASARWRISLATLDPLPDEPLLRGELEVLLDDPQNPRFALAYAVHLR